MTFAGLAPGRRHPRRPRARGRLLSARGRGLALAALVAPVAWPIALLAGWLLLRAPDPNP